METKKEGRLPFLDVMMTRKPNGTLAHTVYRKPAHTHRYLNSGSNHHPNQKRGMITTLSERARRVCKPSELEKKLKIWKGIETPEMDELTKKWRTRRAAEEPLRQRGHLCPRTEDAHATLGTSRKGKFLEL